MFILLLLLPGLANGQQAPAPDPSALAMNVASLPPASPRHPYRFQFLSHGGIPPVRYELAEGAPPHGMTVTADGMLAGTPSAVGEYRFSVSVTDSNRPPQTATRMYILRVVAPLLMEWKRYAKVSGSRIDGSVVVSNGTEDDFDFTFIVLAVNEFGRATAIGYQHIPVKSGTDSLEIPFGETLPRGTYDVHVDGVGEVPAKDTIYRRRLQTKEKLAVTVGP
jgi:Putative Ig domain